MPKPCSMDITERNGEKAKQRKQGRHSRQGVLRALLLHRAEVGLSLAAKLHAPARHAWQRSQNAEQLLLAAERAGAALRWAAMKASLA